MTLTKNEKTSFRQTLHGSYNPAYFTRLFAVEDRHFWFRARNQIIANIAGQISPTLAADSKVLEIGCGTGNVLRFLEKAFPHNTVFGMDLFAEGLRYARQRTSCPLIHGDMDAPPFRTRFGMIGLFDVLEHLPNDAKTLRQIHSMLEPDGILLLTVPAHSVLWSYFDEAAGHCRRYEQAGLKRTLINAGFRIEYLTQYMATLFPLIWLGRRLAAFFAPPAGGKPDREYDLVIQELRIIPVVNGLLAFLLAQEARFIARRCHVPIGTSLLAVARKDKSLQKSGL
jgi:SAM-dependent methyltransferase